MPPNPSVATRCCLHCTMLFVHFVIPGTLVIPGLTVVPRIGVRTLMASCVNWCQPVFSVDPDIGAQRDKIYFPNPQTVFIFVETIH